MSETIRGNTSAEGKTVAVVVARWNELVTNALLDGALAEIAAAGAQALVVHVPGTWEIPVAVRALLTKRQPYAVVALGCILQGQTMHAKLLAGDVGSALMRLQAESGVPVAWGVLTPDTQEQALDRAGLKHGNKGREATLAALETASALAKL